MLMKIIIQFILLPFILLSLILVSCSDPKLDNPFDPESGYNTTPMDGELSLTQITDSQVKLEWQLNSTIVGNYVIKRQINSGSYENLATVDKDTNTYTDTELLTTDTYHYQIIGANGDVQTEPLSNSISTSFTEITNFSIQQENLFTAKLTWQHNCNYEEGYIIERREISSRENPLSRGVSRTLSGRGVSSKLPFVREEAVGRGICNSKKDFQKDNNTSRDFIQIANLSANTIEFADGTLLPNHTYEYRIHAYSSLNQSSAKQSQKLIEFPAPDNFNIEQNDVHTFTLTWEDIDKGEQHYVIERKIDDESFIVIANDIQPATETYIDDINLRNTFENVYYHLYGFYEGENSQFSVVSSAITFLPISDLNYEQLDIHSIQLTWVDLNLNEDGFIIEKKVDSGNWELYATVADTTFIDENAEINQNLQYRVQVYSGLNSTGFVETENINNTFPAPTNLIITQENVHTFSLIWNDNSNGEQGFHIERKIDDEAYTLINTNTYNDTTYIDDINTREQFDIVCYRINAFAGANSSVFVDGSNAINFPAPDSLQYQQITISSIQLTWDDNSDGEEGFKIDKKVGTNAWQEDYATVAENVVTWTDTAAEINEDIQYSVYAYSGDNQSDSIETGVIDNVFPAPENLSYTIEYQSSTTADINLNWDYSANGIDGFKVKKNGTLLTEIIPSGTTEWIDIGVNIGGIYTYQVLAFYQSYNSAYSNEVTWEMEIPENMIFVLGGSFEMGDHYNEGGSDELPLHLVTLDDFFIGECEVTQAEYEALVGSNPSYFSGDDLPVEQVSWYDAVTFCNLKSQQDGLTPCYNLFDWSCDFTADGYRLPTEAEWEYAARGGENWTDDYRYSGCHDVSDLPDYAWYSSNSNSQTHPVGTKLPNQLEIYDMSGNVWEWCNDWYNSNYYSSSPSSNPHGPDSGSSRVLRGGSWSLYDYYCRVAIRYNVNPSSSYYYYGFRIARTP